jgi:acetyl esterase/lipase
MAVKNVSRILARVALAGGLASATVVPASGEEPDPPISIDRALVYASPAGEDLHADVYRPPGAGPFPAVLVVHGGSWTRGNRSRMTRVAERLAGSGYTAVSVDYRLAPAHRFPAPVHDCKTAVRWIRQHADELHVDPKRVGGFGYSSGAHLVAMLATTTPRDGLEGEAPQGAPSSRIQAAVLGGTPTDLRRFPANLTMRRFLGGSPDELPDLYAFASPITYVSPDDPPMFLYHGTRDWFVDVSQARTMAKALDDAGVPHELHESDLGHAATFVMDGDEVAGAIRFLDRWLKGAR